VILVPDDRGASDGGRQIGSQPLVVALPLAATAQAPWWPPALAAFISLAGVVFVAVYNTRATGRSEKRQEKLAEATLAQQQESAQKLEDVRSALTEARDEASASRDYRFDALKRLYTDLDPLLFQLREQSESALFRIYGLAKSARSGKLVAEATSKRGNRLHRGSGSYLPSTLYRFMAPLATFRLCQERLTEVDLSLDDGSRQQQYLFAKLLYRSWSDGDEIAEIKLGDVKALEYDTDHHHHHHHQHANPAVCSQQHLSVQKIERIIEWAMITREGTPRCLTLGEFFSAYESDNNTRFHKAIEPLKDVFVSFNPGSRPVLWRLLVVHAYLYTGLSGRGFSIGDLESVFDDDERTRLSWTGRLDVEDPAFPAARKYLTDQILWRAVEAKGAAITPAAV
jgi:hypothetical protein